MSCGAAAGSAIPCCGSAIRKLRKKPERTGAVGYIGTAWGHGYVLTVPLSSRSLEERIAA